MAEFTKVMKQAKRMCMLNAQASCGGCPLNMEYGCKIMQGVLEYGGIDGERPEDVERIVMSWAEKNPEPRYPTWNEWYKATFPNSNYHTIPCPSMFYKICETSNYHGEVECYECKNSPIPADIAEKLGIKPIGGE